MKQLFSIILFLVVALVANAQEYRDVIYLKNGSVIKGFYKSFFLNDTLRMETLDGSKLVCPASDILRIAKERTDVYVIQRDEYDGVKRHWRTKGYSGSVELIYAIYVKGEELTTNGFSTTHGYRFNDHLFLGAGLGYETYTRNSGSYKVVVDNAFSMYSEGRWYVTHTRIAPVLSCRVGYTLNDFEGGFVAPGIGVDFGISPRVGGFLRFQYRWQKYKYDTKDENNTAFTKKGNMSFLVFTGGLHF